MKRYPNSDNGKGDGYGTGASRVQAHPEALNVCWWYGAYFDHPVGYQQLSYSGYQTMYEDSYSRQK